MPSLKTSVSHVGPQLGGPAIRSDTPSVVTTFADGTLQLPPGGRRVAVGVARPPSAGQPVSMRPLPVPHELGPAEVADRAWRYAAAVLPGSLVAVSSADGGVGRSTLAAALGGVLALAVPGPVVAVDMHPVPWGGLAERIGRQNVGTVWDAFRDLDSLTSLREVQRWAQHGPSGLLALVGETEGQGRRPPQHDEAATVVEAICRLAAVTVCDVMPALITGVWRTLGAAHAPVVVARATVDSVRHSLRLLTHLRAAGFGPVADRCVLVVMATSPRTGRDVRAVLRQAHTAALSVVNVPFDPGLAVPEPIDVRRLQKPTRHALVQLAEQVLLRCSGGTPTAVPGHRS